MAKKKNQEPRDYYQVKAVVSAEEHDIMHRKMAAAGMNITEFMRAMIRSTGVVERKDDLAPDLRRLNAWLGRVNSNLNMLSHHANKYKDEADSLLVASQLNRIRVDIEAIREFALSLKDKKRVK